MIVDVTIIKKSFAKINADNTIPKRITTFAERIKDEVETEFRLNYRKRSSDTLIEVDDTDT
jgi:hypothetical protein